jgi:hypothetical protein
VLLLVGSVEGQPRILVISSSGREAHDLLTAIRSVDLVAAFRPGSTGLPPPREMVDEWGVVIVPSRGELSPDESWKLCEYARLGGGVLLLSQGAWNEYAGSAMEHLAPTFFAYEHPTPHPVRVHFVAEHPAMAVAAWRSLGVIRPGTEIRSPLDPRFARPKTSELERFHKPLLSREWEVWVRGDDPGRTPLVIGGLYGAGRVAIASFGPEVLCGVPPAQDVCRPLLYWLAGTGAAPERPAKWIAAVGGAENTLVGGYGFSVREAESDWERLDAVVCAGDIDEGTARKVSRYVAGGGTLIILDPALLHGCLSEFGSLGSAGEVDDPLPAMAWCRGGTPLDASGDNILLPWSGLSRISGKLVLDKPPVRKTIRLRWGTSQNSSAVMGDVGLQVFTVNGRTVETGQDGVCSLTGLLNQGTNIMEAWAWGDGLHGLPSPRLETGAAGRLETPDGSLTRQSFSGQPWAPLSGEAAWGWEDDRPALVKAAWRQGTVWWLTAPVMRELVNPRLHRYKQGRPAKRDFFRETTHHLPSMVVHEALYGKQHVPRVELTAGSRAVSVGTGSAEERLVWRLYNWQRSLVGHGTADGECEIPLPEPDDALGYEATTYRDEYWLEVGVLTPSGNKVMWWTERYISPEPMAKLTVLLPSVVQRSGNPFVTFPRSEELPTEWTTPDVAEFPLFLPGDSIEVTALCTSRADTQATLTLGASLPLSGSFLELDDDSLTLRAGLPEMISVRFSVQEGFAPVLLQADLLAGGRRVARAAKPLYIVEPTRGLRSVLEVRNKGMQVMGSQYDQSDPEEFARHNLLADPPKGLAWGPYASAYPGQPWCNWHPHPHGIFPNGRYYRDWLRPQIERLARAYNAGPDRAVSASLVDGFNGVPDPEGCFFPQNLYAFARWMQAAGEPIESATVGDLVETVRWRVFDRWSHFVASELALANHEVFKQHLTALSPWSDVIDQCDFPLLHQLLGIPQLEELAPRWESVFSLSSTDAWNVQVGRGYHSPTYTQMLAKALAPGLHLGHYHMEMFGGDGVELISLAERMRRQNYDVFWMMVLDRTGQPHPLQDYFDGGGVSWLGGWRRWLPVCAGGDRGGHVDTDHDWWALMHAYALMEAVGPEKPVGACWLAASNRYGPPGYDPDYWMGDGALLFSLLRDNGVSIPVTSVIANAGDLTGAGGVILTPPAWLEEQQLETLRGLTQDGKGLALTSSLGRGRHGKSPLEHVCGLKYLGPYAGVYRAAEHTLVGEDRRARGDASSSYGEAGMEVFVELVPMKEGRGEDQEPRVLVGRTTAGRGRVAFWADGALRGPFAGGREVDHVLARIFARTVNWTLDNPLVFDDGTAGYAFESEGMTFIVVEELTGVGRRTTVGLRTDTGGDAHCVDLNTNTPLSNRHDGSYLWIDVPLRPSGATLVVASSLR